MAKQQQSKDNGNSLYEKQLRQMRERWNKGKEQSKKDNFSGTTLSPGQFATRLTGAKLISGDKGLSVVFEFTCVRGDEIGEKGIRFAGLGTDEQLVYFQRDLRRLGIEVDDFEPEQIPDILKELLEARPGVRINVKQNGEYKNVYVDKLMELDPEEDVQPGENGEGSGAEASGGDDSGEDAGDGGEGAGEVTFEPGDDVSYTVKGKKQTGVVKKLLDDGSYNVKNDATKQIDNVEPEKLKLLAAT